MKEKKSLLRMLHPFITAFLKNQNLKSTSNEKLLRSNSKKIDLFRGERENIV